MIPVRDGMALIKEQAAEIERLKAELARLTPSGHVAENEGRVAAFLKNGNMFSWAPLAIRNALSRLAAKAQGYEAMKAELEGARALNDGLRAECRHYAKERDAALAAHAAAEKRFEQCEAERIAAGEALDDAKGDLRLWRAGVFISATHQQAMDNLKAENERALRLASHACAKSERVEKDRNAAVADNAARLKQAVHGMACRPPYPEGCRCVLSQPHPGAALLAEHAKALVRARNEGREEAAQTVDDAGPRFEEIKEPEL